MIRRLILGIGTPGVLGLGLGLFCHSFYVGNIDPARDALSTIDRDIAKLERQLGQDSRPSTGEHNQGTVASPAAEIPGT